MGLWRDNRPQVMACLCFTAGLAVLVWASATFASSKGTEVKLWFNVPLCSATVAPTVATVGVVPKSMFMSQNPIATAGVATSPVSVCPANPSAVGVEELVYSVPKKYFIAGATYTTFLQHTDGSDISEAPGTFVKVKVDGKYDWITTGADPVRRLEGSRRRLLKGGFSSSSSYSGPSYRSRNGNFNYWGTRTYNRRYGRSGVSAVESDTIVNVYSPSPVFSSRSGTAYLSTAASSCKDVETGCEYTITAPLTKSELTKGKWSIPETESLETGSYTLRVKANVSYSLTSTSAYPNLFVVFATDLTTPEELIGYIFIPLACLIICCGTACALATKWSFCPGSRSSYSSLSHASSSTSMTSNPMKGNARAPEVDVPMPRASGSSMLRRNGSFRNLSSVSSSAEHVDLTSNDVSSMTSYSRLNVKTLVLRNNDLANLSGVATSAPLLEALDVVDNDLFDLSGIHLPQLRWLNVRNNRLRSLGGSGAGVCPNLAYLNAADNDLANLAGINNFPGLTHLDVGNNDITTVHGLAGACPKLERVNLAQNNMIDADAVVELVNLPSMNYLNIKGNDMRAMQIQKIIDAAEARPGFTLVR